MVILVFVSSSAGLCSAFSVCSTTDVCDNCKLRCKTSSLLLFISVLFICCLIKVLALKMSDILYCIIKTIVLLNFFVLSFLSCF